MACRLRRVLPLAITVALLAPSVAVASGWPWPVVGAVIRAFDPPETPYGAGHRGIDIAVPIGTEVLAPAPGVVSFAGRVGGHLYLTVDHGGGVQTTYSWLSALLVRKGHTVLEGMPVARTGLGHPGSSLPHLHLGVKVAGVYVDPMTFLSEGSVVELIRLAPMPADGFT